ncbi:transposase [Nonomuraea polychroma]|uniref:transposase n=1 Tax=Nonomuraea polychroma TaxID=46176 RepID=UPI003BADB714
MAEYGDIRTGRHGVFVLHTHVVFVTKFRHRPFTGEHLTRLQEITRSVCADFENRAAPVQRRRQPRPPAGQLPTHGGPVQAGRSRDEGPPRPLHRGHQGGHRCGYRSLP